MEDGAYGVSTLNVVLIVEKEPKTDPVNATTRLHNTVEKNAMENLSKLELAFLNHVCIILTIFYWIFEPKLELKNEEIKRFLYMQNVK